VYFVKKEIVLNIEGMRCPLCEKNLARALTETAGVKKAKVSLEKKSAAVTYDDEKTDVQKIAASVAEAGYRAV
jgi:copper chaperone CopZ